MSEAITASLESEDSRNVAWFQFPRPPRRSLLVAVACLLLLAGILAASHQSWTASRQPAPIKLGLLHSKTGPLAVTESAWLEGELLAIEEINAEGGVLGRPVEAVVADGRSDWPTFASEAERLITEEHVVSIVGCWASASRKTVKPVIERLAHLLVYPEAYEGLEQSPNIFYIGAAPNQQILPALKWGLERFGPRVFLVGSDYVWPHSVNAIMKDRLKPLGGELVGEEYIALGSSRVEGIVEAIKAARPDVIFSAIAGDTNAPFYRALRAAGLNAETVPVMSFSIGENEARAFPTADFAGHYVASSYLGSLDNPVNRDFVERYRKRFGADKFASEGVASGYVAVRLWAQAVRSAGTTRVDAIRAALRNQSFEAPEGIVSIDRETQHAWRQASLGRIGPDGRVEVAWTAARAIRPVPYPNSRTPARWEAFLDDLYQRWGNSWANPVGE